MKSNPLGPIAAPEGKKRTTALTQEALRAVGCMVLSGFGAMWMVGWCLAVHGSDWRPLLLIIAVGTSLTLLGWRGLRRHPRIPLTPELTARNQRIRAAFKWSNIVQWSLILGLAVCLDQVGQDRWLDVVILTIVGLHFVPLARALEVPEYYATGLALVLLALIFPLFSAQGPESPVGALGAGLILWTTALAVALPQTRGMRN